MSDNYTEFKKFFSKFDIFSEQVTHDFLDAYGDDMSSHWYAWILEQEAPEEYAEEHRYSPWVWQDSPGQMFVIFFYGYLVDEYIEAVSGDKSKNALKLTALYGGLCELSTRVGDETFRSWFERKGVPTPTVDELKEKMESIKSL